MVLMGSRRKPRPNMLTPFLFMTTAYWIDLLMSAFLVTGGVVGEANPLPAMAGWPVVILVSVACTLIGLWAVVVLNHPDADTPQWYRVTVWAGYWCIAAYRFMLIYQNLVVLHMAMGGG
uniref:Uncharacterized protein n=1 Tax=viral metagenome TaxID=1070528 RepID=A0A6M3IL72_9ZZZZ